MIIKDAQLEQLTHIYNALLNVNTNGQSTLIMADCLRALEGIIMEIPSNQEE